MYLIPISISVPNIIIGIGSIGAGIIGLQFDDLKSNKPEVLKVFIITSLLCLFSLVLVFNLISPIFLWKALIILSLSLLTGLGTAKLSEELGTKALVIPRFLLGFIISSIILFHAHWWWSLHYGALAMCASIVGLIFSQIKLFTSSFILAILVLSGYTWLFINGLSRISYLPIHNYFIMFILCSSVAIFAALLRLYYFWKEGSHLPIEGTGALIEGGESQPIRSDQNPSYNTVNADEEANFGN